MQSAGRAQRRAGELRVVTKTAADRRRSSDDLLFAWRVAKFVKSNAIVFCGGGRTLGIGAGQMSRVDSRASPRSRRGTRACRSPARWSRRTRSSRSATASTWSPTAGAVAVIQPGGSMRDDEVIAAADERGIAMVFTGIRHFRH